MKRSGQYQPLGMRMRDFGRSIMRHYVPKQQFPSREEPTPPAWQQDAATPLLWEEASLPAAESVSDFVPETPVPPSEASAPHVPTPKPTPTTAAPTVQRESAAPPPAPKSNPKYPASLLKLLENDRKREAEREQIREERLAKFNEQLTDSDPEKAAKLQRRRGKMSVNYVDTKPLAHGEEPIQRQTESAPSVAEPDAVPMADEPIEPTVETGVESSGQSPEIDTGAAPDTPVVDSLQRSASEQMSRAAPEFPPPVTVTGAETPIEVPPARDLLVQREPAPMSAPPAPASTETPAIRVLPDVDGELVVPPITATVQSAPVEQSPVPPAPVEHETASPTPPLSVAQSDQPAPLHEAASVSSVPTLPDQVQRAVPGEWSRLISPKSCCRRRAQRRPNL